MKLMIEPLAKIVSFHSNENEDQDTAKCQQHLHHSFLFGSIHVFFIYTPADMHRMVGCKIEGTGLTLFVKSCYFSMKREGLIPNCFLKDLLNENTSANPQ